MDLEQELQFAVETVLSTAKAVIQERTANGITSKTKSNGDPITNLDEVANRILIERISSTYPNHSLLSEESQFQDNSSSYVWIIDPIDGTKGLEENISTINMALTIDGGVVLGAIHYLFTNTLYYAAKGSGAFKYMTEPKQIHVSDRRDNLRLITSADNAALREFYRKGNFYAWEKLGSSAKGCLLGKGDFDVYPSFGTNKSIWDICAMHPIVEEAGGRFTYMDGSLIKYCPKKIECDPILASNGIIHDSLVELAQTHLK